jgi:GAF domain-containing protein
MRDSGSARAGSFVTSFHPALPPDATPLRWLDALGAAMRRVSAVAAPEDVFDALASAIVDDLGVPMVAVWVHDPAQNAVLLKATAGIPGYRERAPGRLPPDDLSLGIVRVAMQREPEILPEIGPESGFKDPAWLASIGLRAYAGLPLVLQDQGS